MEKQKKNENPSAKPRWLPTRCVSKWKYSLRLRGGSARLFTFVQLVSQLPGNENVFSLRASAPFFAAFLATEVGVAYFQGIVSKSFRSFCFKISLTKLRVDTPKGMQTKF